MQGMIATESMRLYCLLQEYERRDLQIFLLALPIGTSFSSSTMHTSSISLICSSSYPARSASWVAVSRAAPIRVVLTSGKRRRTFSDVICCVSVTVVDISITAFQLPQDDVIESSIELQAGCGAVLRDDCTVIVTVGRKGSKGRI